MTVQVGSFVQVEGLAELRKRFQASDRALVRAQRIAVRRAAFRVRTQAQGHFERQSPFRRTIVVQVDPRHPTAIVGSVARAAESIHRGRKPGRPPSSTALIRWIERRGLSGAMSVRSRRVVRRRRSARAQLAHEAATRDMAFRIQREIREAGTKPIPFLANALPPIRADLDRYFREALADFVRNDLSDRGRRKVA